jgi:polyisoprenoid-binding protein YceI
MRSRLSSALLLALLPAWAGAESRTYEVDPAKSTLQVSVGKSGLFSFAGHGHEVIATSFGGTVVADEADLGRSTVNLVFQAAALKLGDKDEPPEDVPKVQEKMAGPEVLDVSRFPTVHFRSTGVKGKPVAKGGYDLELVGELELHGVTKGLTLPVHVDLAEESLTATGTASLRQTDFGIKPVSVAGVVKVKDELSLKFSVEAHRLR